MFEILFLFGLIIAIGFASRWVFERTRVPEVIILLLIGFALGPLGLIKYFGIPAVGRQEFEGIAPLIGAVAIISMVFEAGLRLRVKEFPANIAKSALSAALNIGVCIVILGGILHFALGWGKIDALLFGTILGGMSSFAAYSILPLTRTTNKLRNAIYLEGTLSTIAISIMSIALLRYSWLSNQNGLAGLSSFVFLLFSVSFIIGLVLGVLLLLILLNFKVKRLSFFLLFAALLMAYFIDFSYLGGIGVISVAMIGFVLANSEDFFRLIKKTASFEVDESFKGVYREISLFINTFFFVYLGFIFRPEQLGVEEIFAPVLLVAGIFLARAIVSRVMRKITGFQRHEEFLSTVIVPRDILTATLAAFAFVFLPYQPVFSIEIVCLVIAYSAIASSAGISWYERIFKNTFLFRTEVVLKDKRKVIVRSFTRDDIGKLRGFFNEFVKEGAYIAIDQRISAAEEKEMGLDTIAKMNKKEMIVWVVEYQNNIVGQTVAQKMPKRERDNVSLSFYIAKDFRGAGLGRILIKMIVKEAKTTFNPHNLYLTVYSDNRKAIKLYEMEGFVKCGVLPGWMKYNNTYLDRIYMVYDPLKAKKKNKHKK